LLYLPVHSRAEQEALWLQRRDPDMQCQVLSRLPDNAALFFPLHSGGSQLCAACAEAHAERFERVGNAFVLHQQQLARQRQREAAVEE
jgi:hypothetical protein